MTVNFPLLLIALVLLWLPRQMLRRGYRIGSGRRRSDRAKNPAEERGPQDFSMKLLPELGKLRNYVDIGRAALGSAVIFGTEYTESCIAVGASAAASAQRSALIVRFAIILIALLLQTVRFEPTMKLFAPIFFVSGLSFGLCGLKVAGFSLVMIWAINLAGIPPAGFLFFYGIVIGTFGFLFNGVSFSGPANRGVIMSAALALLPPMIGWMSRKPLVHFTKRVKIDDDGDKRA